MGPGITCVRGLIYRLDLGSRAGAGGGGGVSIVLKKNKKTLDGCGDGCGFGCGQDTNNEKNPLLRNSIDQFQDVRELTDCWLHFPFEGKGSPAGPTYVHVMLRH